MATLCLTVDNLGNALRVGTGEAVRPDPDEPGLRALPAVLDLFAELSVTATFFVEGWNGLHHPEALRAIARRGHEVGLHGWVHERWSEIGDARRETLLFDGTAALRAAGVTPVGFRAPGGYRGGRTAEVLAELGYAFDSSIDPRTERESPRVGRLPGGLVGIPWHWDMIDYWHYVMHPDAPRTPAQLLEHWTRRLRETVRAGGLCTVILHPFVSFVDDARVAVVRRFLREALDTPGLDVLSAGQVAARFRDGIRVGAC